MAKARKNSARKGASATAADAQLVLQLYDLRRETEMRKARNWIATEFWPTSADDLIKLARDFGSQHNAWFRQVYGYWDMAASLVLQGALNERLFFSTGGEMWFVFSKVQPFVKEVRDRLQSPEAFRNLEQLATRTAEGRERLTLMQQRLAAFTQSRQAAGGR